MTNDVNSLPILRLSPSSIKTYEQCARKYYHGYVAKTKVEKKEWDHLTVGNFVHEVLETFHNNLIKKSVDRFEILMQDCFNQAAQQKDKFGRVKHKLNPETDKEAKDILRNYLRYLASKPLPNVLSNEKAFNIELDSNLIVRGVIDRIDFGTDEDATIFHVIDYKTGQSKYLDEFQLLVYGAALLEENPNLVKIKATYLMLKENMKEVSQSFDKKNIEDVRVKIKTIAEQIRQDKSWEAKPSFLCNYCDYNKVCEFSVAKKEIVGGEIEWT